MCCHGWTQKNEKQSVIFISVVKVKIPINSWFVKKKKSHLLHVVYEPVNVIGVKTRDGWYFCQ